MTRKLHRPLDRLRDIVVRYLVAVCAAAAGLVFRFLLPGELGATMPYMTFFPAVMFAAWFGGGGPGALATVLSLTATLRYVVAPRGFRTVTQAELVGALLFLVVSLFVSALTEAPRQARFRSDERFEELREQTERRALAEQATEQARELAEQARDLFLVTLSSIGDGVIATDAEGRVTFINGIAEALTGWTLSEASGRHIDEVLVLRNELTGEPAPNPVLQVIARRDAVGLANHTELISKTGSRIAIEDSASPIRADDTALLGVVMVIRDASERRAAEASLRGSEERLQLGPGLALDFELLGHPGLQLLDLAHQLLRARLVLLRLGLADLL